MMSFRFYLPSAIHFGEDSLHHLVNELADCFYEKIALVYDHNLALHPLLVELQDVLERRNIVVVAQPVTVAEPTYDYLDIFRRDFMESAVQAVVGVGGGSTLDVAKAVAVLVHNREPAVSYRGFDRMTEPVLPIYACPTTAGTGSEITPNASFVDAGAQKKLGINGETIRPRGAYLHPGFIVTCPQKPAVYAAIDALVHAIEAFVAAKCTPPARMFAQEAVDLLLQNIVAAVRDKECKAIENVFWGSLLAAVAMMHSGTGPTAALSYPLGVRAKVPHGLAGAVFLPQVMRWNIARGYHGYGEMLRREQGDDDAERRSCGVVDALAEIWRQLDIPDRAGKVGLLAADIDLYLCDLVELRGAIEQNPIPMREDDLRNLLLDAL